MARTTTPEWGFDGWNAGVVLTLGGAVLSLLGAVGAERASQKASLTTLGTVLGAAGTIVSLAMPPRCPMCLRRARPLENGGHWCDSCLRPV